MYRVRFKNKDKFGGESIADRCILVRNGKPFLDLDNKFGDGWKAALRAGKQLEP